ncbi:hypothetical protein VARIO8X_50033 [Burkholderiales bacterium 8X]|nr:hypothetical protein VARIO8X_50033 [Burkholderiales bacterium 8X]
MKMRKDLKPLAISIVLSEDPLSASTSSNAKSSVAFEALCTHEAIRSCSFNALIPTETIILLSLQLSFALSTTHDPLYH